MILLDTHVLWWLDQADPTLGENSLECIEAAHNAGELAVSAISFWELEVLLNKGRLKLNHAPEIWRRELLENGLIEIPVNGEIGIRADRLDLPHRDPADRMITATAELQSATLVTADKKILLWESELPRIDARQ